jgi:hypothetical protein
MTRRPNDREMLNDDAHAGDYYTEQHDAYGTISIQHCDAPTMTHATISDERTTFLLGGRAPQHEEGTPETCARLADALTRRDGNTWTVEAKDKVSRPQGDADGYVRNRSEDQPVPVQVTRAGKWERWRLLNTTGSAVETIQPASAAEEVWNAIADKSTIPDAAMILAVRGLPGIHTTRTVVDELRRAHGPELDRLCYREVWLIGSSPDTHFCLRPFTA